MIRRKKNRDNYVLDALFEFLWGVEVALICVVIDYFIILNVLEKLYVSCNDVTICPQSTTYNCLYVLSILIWIFAVIYPISLFIIAFIKGYKNKK